MIGPRLWFVAGLAFVALQFLDPTYIDNETAYVLPPIRLLHSGFLPTHPFLSDLNPFFLAYDLVAAPFYRVLPWLWATLLLRVLIWGFQLWALGRLGRRLGLSPAGLFLALVLWLNVEQTVVAGEWIVGCASAKPVGYGFLFLAMEALLADRLRAAGVFAGLATMFHLLVGGWATLALGAMAIVRDRNRPFWKVGLQFGIPAALVAGVGLAPALIATLTGSGVSGGPQEARLYVQWANPYHLDPVYFMSTGEYFKIVLYLVTTLLLAWKMPARGTRTALLAFLGVIAAIFGTGLVARRLEAWDYLAYYPFRVADGMYPLVFWLLVAIAIQRLVRKAGRQAWIVVVLSLVFASAARWGNNRLDPQTPERERHSLAWEIARSEPRMAAYHGMMKLQMWWRFLRGAPEDDFAVMAEWVGGHTPADAVVIVPPWRPEFAILSQRSEVVSSKILKPGQMGEIKARLEALNGGPLDMGGREMFQVLRQGYPRLREDQLLAAARAFSAQYVVTRTEYTFPLLHQEGPWRLYRLEVAGEAGPVEGTTRSGLVLALRNRVQTTTRAARGDRAQRGGRETIVRTVDAGTGPR